MRKTNKNSRIEIIIPKFMNRYGRPIMPTPTKDFNTYIQTKNIPFVLY